MFGRFLSPILMTYICISGNSFKNIKNFLLTVMSKQYFKAYFCLDNVERREKKMCFCINFFTQHFLWDFILMHYLVSNNLTMSLSVKIFGSFFILYLLFLHIYWHFIFIHMCIFKDKHILNYIVTKNNSLALHYGKILCFGRNGWAISSGVQGLFLAMHSGITLVSFGKQIECRG